MPKIVDHDQYRKELLGKCFTLFAEKGYASITMRQIAQELEVSTGTLYHYFPSKEALFEQMVEEMSTAGLQKFAIQVEKAKSLPERVELAFDYVICNEAEFIKESLIWIEFFQQQGWEAMQHNDVFKRSYQRTQAELSRLLGIQDPQLAVFLISLIDGLLFARLYTQNGVSLTEQRNLLKKMLAAYLKEYPQAMP